MLIWKSSKWAIVLIFREIGIFRSHSEIYRTPNLDMHQKIQGWSLLFINHPSFSIFRSRLIGARHGRHKIPKRWPASWWVFTRNHDKSFLETYPNLLREDILQTNISWSQDSASKSGFFGSLFYGQGFEDGWKNGDFPPQIELQTRRFFFNQRRHLRPWVNILLPSLKPMTQNSSFSPLRLGCVGSRSGHFFKRWPPVVRDRTHIDMRCQMRRREVSVRWREQWHLMFWWFLSAGTEAPVKKPHTQKVRWDVRFETGRTFFD